MDATVMANDEFFITTTKVRTYLAKYNILLCIERWPRVRSVVTHHFVARAGTV